MILSKIISFLGVGTVLLGLWLLYKLFRILFRVSPTTRLHGPPDGSFLFGCVKILHEVDDTSVLYKNWANQYGPVFEIKSFLNSKQLVICDPKAIAHFYANETFLYVHTRGGSYFLENFFGRGLLWSQGESHRRQRKAMAPAFSNAAIRRMTSVFFDSSYKVKASWDAMIESSPNGEAIIEVQSWMNYIALDSIGIAGFSHDFRCIDGQRSTVVKVFEEMGSTTQSVTGRFIMVASLLLPILFRLPTRRNKLLKQMNSSMNVIAVELLERSRREGREKDSGLASKSLIELLIKAESNSLTPEEVRAQMNVLLLAGYETTSITLTWALIELSRQPAVQAKLREELSQFSNIDPAWDQMNNALPYLDAVVHETLRLHPALGTTTRVASNDHIMPLSKPVETVSGTVMDHIFVGKGTALTVPIHAINKSITLWGEDAGLFIPERWLDEAGTAKAKDIQGYRHLLTFVDGPRTCLGRGFAITEIKAVLSVLIRNYLFEFPNGPDTKIGRKTTILQRPAVAGQDGAKVPLRVRRVG